MPDLELDIQANIKQLSADVKQLNKNLEETDNQAERVEKSAKGFGDNIKTAAKAF